MLWHKEPVKNSNIPEYVDLWRRLPRNYMRRHVDLDAKSGNPKKSDKKSTNYRKIGFHCMERANYKLAIEFFNKSICFAKTDSNSANISYGYRSRCFFKLREFVASVKDIELAKDGNYPDLLLADLNKHERACKTLLEQMQPSEMVQRNDLIYSKNGTDQLEFNTFGSNIRPNREIKVGETVCVDEPLCAVLVDQFYKRCSTCLQIRLNLIPCRICVKAMFCSDECRISGIHKKCCTVIWKGKPTGDQMLLLCTLLIVLDLFPSLDDLINIIETFNAATNVTPMRSNLMTMKYRQFFEACKREHYAASDFIKSVVNSLPVFWAIVKHRVYGEQFQSDKSKHFLIHLIAHHWQFIARNLHTTFRAPGTPINLEIMQTDPYAKVICLMKLAMKHSCVPNVYPIAVDKNVIYKAIRPIKTNEFIGISYVIRINIAFPIA